MSTEVQSVVMKAMKEYAGNSLATVKDRENLVDTIFKKLNTNNDKFLSAEDKMSSDWKTLFGIDDSTKLTKSALTAKIDDIVDEMSADGIVVENDYSEDYVSSEKQKEINAGAKQSGADLYKLINGNTANYAYSIVNETLEGVNKDNVLEFLNGYYSERGSGNPEGIIEALDDEWDGGAISMDNKKNLATSLLALAEENGLGNNSDCKIIRAILKMYSEGGSQETATDFNHNHRFGYVSDTCSAVGGVLGAVAVAGKVLATAKTGAAAGAAAGGGVFSWATAAIGAVVAVGASFCDRVTDNEDLDAAMNRLRTKLNEKLGK